jgi:trk system potassium uptake protein TrkA
MKRVRKQICIIGLGQFGSELARSLASKAEVLALDQDEDRVNRIADHVHRALMIDASDSAALASVVTDQIDEAIVSMGTNLEGSILCTLHLTHIGVKKIRVKAANEEHAEILRLVGASQTISPERETARRVAARIVHSNLLDIVPLAEDYRVIRTEAPPSFAGKSLAELGLRSKFGAFVIAVKDRDNGRFTFLPGPDYRVCAEDILTLIGRENDLMKLNEGAG